MSKYELTPEEIGDCLNLEVEATYPCSDGGIVSTVSVDKLLEKVYSKEKEIMLEGEIKMFQNFDERKVTTDVSREVMTFNISLDNYVAMANSLKDRKASLKGVSN